MDSFSNMRKMITDKNCFPIKNSVYAIPLAFFIPLFILYNTEKVLFVEMKLIVHESLVYDYDLFVGLKQGLQLVN